MSFDAGANCRPLVQRLGHLPLEQVISACRCIPRKCGHSSKLGHLLRGTVNTFVKFIRERKYLLNVSESTIEWYEQSFNRSRSNCDGRWFDISQTLTGNRPRFRPSSMRNNITFALCSLGVILRHLVEGEL